MWHDAAVGMNDAWLHGDGFSREETRALDTRRRAPNSSYEFIRLARAVYITNDKRAALKKEINLLLGSSIVEEKSYADY